MIEALKTFSRKSKHNTLTDFINMCFGGNQDGQKSQEK